MKCYVMYKKFGSERDYLQRHRARFKKNAMKSMASEIFPNRILRLRIFDALHSVAGRRPA